MIVYDLYCELGHVFEGWFDDSGDYQSQKERELISCPVCDSKKIEIRLAAAGLRRFNSGGNNSARDGENKHDAKAGETAEVLARLQEYIDENFEDVGKDFAGEVLKMHYGVEESRNIRGVSSPEEEKQLKREGVSFIKLPRPVKIKDKKN